MDHLNKYQREVYEECIKKGSGGLSLPMGYGKTILSIVLGLYARKHHNAPFLVVASKTLLLTWQSEFNKFFPQDTIKILILHADYVKGSIDKYQFNPNNYHVILTTIDVVSKYYKFGRVEDYFITKSIRNEGRFNQHFVNVYNYCSNPYLNNSLGGLILFSFKFSALFVDEVQNYTNILSNRCQGLGAICAHMRWALSGTLFSEMSTARMLGYYVIIGDKIFPRTLPDAALYISSHNFLGYLTSTVYRNTNPVYIMPEIKELQ